MQTQEIIARGVCIQESKILLAYFREKGYFFLPGGHVEPGESVTASLEREVHEELGISTSAGNVISVFEHAWKNEDTSVYELNFLISFSIPKNTELISQVEYLDFKWVTLNEFDSITFLPAELKNGVKNLLMGSGVPPFQSSLL